MEKKYQVFISSTYTDLIEERKKVLDILLMADCIPAGMEAFVATDAEQFEVIKKVIDLCDYYVLILGRRYGSINADTGISYTEMEYEYARRVDDDNASAYIAKFLNHKVYDTNTGDIMIVIKWLKHKEALYGSKD